MFIADYLNEMKERMEDIQSYARSMVTESDQSVRQDLMDYVYRSLDDMDRLIADINAEAGDE